LIDEKIFIELGMDFDKSLGIRLVGSRIEGKLLQDQLVFFRNVHLSLEIYKILEREAQKNPPYRYNQ
jgi:hypothetical protein